MNAFEASAAVDAAVLASVFSVLQPGDPDFAIVTP